MKKLLCLALAAVLLTACTTPKLDTDGRPPAGYEVVPKVPTAF